MIGRVLLSIALAAIYLPASAAQPGSDPAPTTPTVTPVPAASEAGTNESSANKSDTNKAGTSESNLVNLTDVREFTAIYSLVKQAYVEDVDDHQLMQAAIHGLLAGLDPHSEYLGKKQIEDLAEDTSGSYGGLGIEVIQTDGLLRVVTPIDDSPAQRAGVRAGDTIVRVDGKAVQSDDLDGAIERLRGKPGTRITLSILHEKQNTPVDLTLKREEIRVTSVRGRLLEPSYAYVRISQFQDETGAQLRKIVEKLRTDNKGSLRGAVLDLRSNPGGLLDSAVEVSDAFLDNGIIVTTRGRIKESDLSFHATPGDLLNGAPLVVLIDNGTASAAEIVAGALKDNHRALLMGRRTFGKGSVQTVLPLDAEHAVKLTTARYYTPSGISIQAAGIQPDIALADLTLSQRNSEPTLTFGERDLRNHLKGTDERPDDAAASPPATRGAAQDYAINEALNALKALVLRNKPATPQTASDKTAPDKNG
ncbi:MAG: S41 family peptidase [Rhodanobacter sp.]|jgi:carboxyl-terminal processing protease|nr:S41 family peptidase [Rhodanobacter sp.]